MYYAALLRRLTRRGSSDLRPAEDFESPNKGNEYYSFESFVVVSVVRSVDKPPIFHCLIVESANSNRTIVLRSVFVVMLTGES